MMHVLLFFFSFCQEFQMCSESLALKTNKQFCSSSSFFWFFVVCTINSAQMFPGMFVSVREIFNFQKKIKLNGWIHHFAQVATVATRDRFFAIFGFELYISSYQDKMHLFISFHSFTMFKDELVEINQSLVMLIIGFHFWKHVLASLDTCKSHKLE